jgi:putative inorganic carbon (HCO3(-)) transporter
VERLLTIIAWGSAPIVVYGFLQAARLDLFDWHIDAASPVLSTIGRNNFLGSYLVLVIPLTLARAMLGRQSMLSTLLLSGQLVCLALTQARGAWIGFFVAALTFGLAWAIITRERRLAMAILGAAFLLIGFVALLNWPGGPLSPLARLPGLERLATMTRTDAGSTAARLTTWRATLPLIAARPLTGYGLETMRTVFAKVFPPQLVYYQGRHIVVDRAHNLWLDLAMSAGLAGLVTFAVLLAGFMRLAWRGLRASSDMWERVVWIALTAAFIGHLVDLQFVFDLTASATLFWLLLALGVALRLGLSAEGVRRFALPSPRSLLPYIPLALVAIGVIVLVSALPLVADLYHWRAGQVESGLEQRIEAEYQAVRLQPKVPQYRVGLSWLYLLRARADPDPLLWLEAAEFQLEAAGRLSPSDPWLWAARGELYARWGELDPLRYADADAAYARATELAPNIATFYTSWGLVYARQGRLKEAVVKFERAVDLDATDGYAYWHLGEAYAALGEEGAAEAAFREALRWAPELDAARESLQRLRSREDGS